MTEEPWRLDFSARARKDLRRLDPQIRVRVVSALERLTAADDPTVESRRLKGMDEWRIRVGDWRVRFVRDEAARTIFVTHILPRGRVYDR